MRLYAFAAFALLVASSYTLMTRDASDGAIYTVAGVLFWVSGVAFIAVAVTLLGRRLGVFGRGAPGPKSD